MKFIALLCWVLALSWLTHFAASPQWRVSSSASALLENRDALVPSQWTVSKQANIETAPSGALFIQRDPNQWAAIKRTVSLGEGSPLVRVRAVFATDVPRSKRLSLSPKPVFHLFIANAARKYPLVERPMFIHHRLEVDEIVELSPNSESVEVSFVAHPGSHWRMERLSLTAVKQHSRYATGYTAVMALWGLTLLWGVVKAWRRSKIPTLVVGVVLVGVLSAVLASRTYVVSAFNYIATSVRAAGGGVTSAHFTGFMQAGHIVLFAVMTVIVLWFHKHWRLSIGQMLLGLVVLAIATEALQRHAFGRSPDLQDFLFDMLGIAMGCAVCLMMRFYVRISRFRHR